MKKILPAALLAITCSAPASAASLDMLAPYLSTQYFRWEEQNGGRRMLRERGPLFGAGVIVGGITDFSLTLRAKAELIGGVVGYDGETQGPNALPIKTDVTYLGTKHDFDLGYRVRSGRWHLEPFGGAGYRWWLRDLHDTTTDAGDPVSGYTELWQTGYARIGARGRYLQSSGISVFAEGGARYPFYTGNSVDFSGYGTTTFHPHGRWSAFGGVGADLEHLKLTLFYEGERYSQSPLKQVGPRRFFQPDSTSDVFGLSVGWAFR